MAEATIRDVAQLAEVSVASVSRVLNGSGKVSPAVRERVEAAIAALGYVPHAAARSLSIARTHSIGVVLPDLHGEFFSEIVRGMETVASERGYLLLLSSLHKDTSLGTSALRALRGRVDAAVVMAPHLSDAELALTLPPGVPVVLLNKRAAEDSHLSITIDNEGGARAIAEHLLARGCRRFVHIAGPSGNADARERAEAFAAALSGRDGVLLQVVQGDFSEDSGEAAIAALLGSGQHFDAVFAANDNMAMGALQALRAAGKQVPDEIAVVGFDDIPLARHLGLTTVSVRIADLGRRALIALIDGFEEGIAPFHMVHRVDLVSRATTVRS
ncbi:MULTISPECIES: LacI family DNA-binding transcriptional regulator [Sphingomonas]|uniref:LacI family DNA-binding transcriptional regulator n=1 Tax=Sphingomonas TaxID=13687 RepID=UPI0013B44849|nr:MULTISPECIES: LacI family DNA-binding transcriptional regulator [Sphingomonas]